jgi:hypothetical protein
VRSRNIYFSHVPFAVRQGQRRDAVATGEEKLVKFTAGRVNISGFIYTVAIYLRRVRVVCRSSAAGAPPLTHVRWPLRQKKHGVRLRRPCREQVCGGMLEAMARICASTGRWRALPQHGLPRRTQTHFFMFCSRFLQKCETGRGRLAWHQAVITNRSQKFRFSSSRFC